MPYIAGRRGRNLAVAAVSHLARLLLEDGTSFFLLEDGSFLLLE